MFGKKVVANYSIPDEFKLKAQVNELQIYLEAVGKRLDDSVETGQVVTDRATNLLNLSAGLLIALVAYCLQKSELKQHDNLFQTSLWACGVLIVITVLLLIAILPRPYCMPGASAQILFTNGLFAEQYSDEIRLKCAYISLIESYENSIIENNSRNRRRMTVYKIALLITILAPVCFFTDLLVRP